MAYQGWKLTESSRDALLVRFPPRFADVVAHHVTLSLKGAMPEQATIRVIGYATDDVGIEALVVSVNGSSYRGEGQTYHITWSLDREAGYKPVDSNRMLREHHQRPLDGNPHYTIYENEIAVEVVAFWVDDAKNEFIRVDDEATERARSRCLDEGLDPNFVGTKGYPNYHMYTDEALAQTRAFLDETAAITRGESS